MRRAHRTDGARVAKDTSETSATRARLVTTTVPVAPALRRARRVRVMLRGRALATSVDVQQPPASVCARRLLRVARVTRV